jgi:hypothetical protein
MLANYVSLLTFALNAQGVFSMGAVFGFTAINVGVHELRQYGSGKFNLKVDEWLYLSTLDGGPDEETSFPEGRGWYGLVRVPTNGASLHYFDDTLPNLTYDEIAYLDQFVGAILSTDSKGFVSVDYYDDEEELAEHWNDVASDVETILNDGVQRFEFTVYSWALSDLINGDRSSISLGDEEQQKEDERYLDDVWNDASECGNGHWSMPIDPETGEPYESYFGKPDHHSLIGDVVNVEWVVIAR